MTPTRMTRMRLAGLTPATPAEVRQVAQELYDSVHEVFIVHGIAPRAGVHPDEPIVDRMARILIATDDLLRWADIQAGGDGLLLPNEPQAIAAGLAEGLG